MNFYKLFTHAEAGWSQPAGSHLHTVQLFQLIKCKFIGSAWLRTLEYNITHSSDNLSLYGTQAFVFKLFKNGCYALIVNNVTVFRIPYYYT